MSNGKLLTPLGRRMLAFLVMLALVLAWAVFVSGCSSTVIPQRVEATEVAFEGNTQNAGVLAVDRSGAVITERKRAEYLALVKVYGRGTADYPIEPKVSPKAGLTRLSGKEAGFPEHEWVWAIDAEHLTWFITFRDWQRAGRKPK